jgi:hypothetical protein
MRITRDQKRIFHALVNTELDKLELTREELQALIESVDWQRVIEAHAAFIQSIKTLVPGNNPAPAAKNQTEFTISVCYELSIEDARKAGNYDWESSDITSKHYPTIRTGMADITLRLVHFDYYIESDEVVVELDRMGLRPAETHELLALGAAHPELQREFPIICLGSVWQVRHGNRVVPYLGRNDSERLLLLGWFGGGWDECCRFAAVPK